MFTVDIKKKNDTNILFNFIKDIELVKYIITVTHHKAMAFHQILGTLLSALMHAMDNPEWLSANPLAYKTKSWVITWIQAYGNQQPFRYPADAPAIPMKTASDKPVAPVAPAHKASAAAPAPKASAAAPAPKASAAASAPNASAAAPKSHSAFEYGLPKVTGKTKTWKTVGNKKKKEKKQSKPQRNPKCSVPGDDYYVVIQNHESKLYIVWAEDNGIIRKLEIYNNFSSNKYLRTFKSAILPGKKERGEVLYSTLVERGGYLSYSKSGWASFCVRNDSFYCDLVDELLYE